MPSDVNLPDFVETITIGNIITWITLVAGIVVLVRKVTPAMKKLSDTLDDIQGERARPGVPARPGIMERLATQDVSLMNITDKLETAVTNHALVMDQLGHMAATQKRYGKQIDRNSRNVARVETMLLQHIHDSQVWIADLGRSADHYNFKVPDWPQRPAEPGSSEDPDDDDPDPVGT